MTAEAGLAAPFPVVSAAALETRAAASPQWLIEQLWSAQAVGIIGGAPKSCKTWMALEMAVAVASGSACLGSFTVPTSGRVLLYAAEDSATALRLRLESLAKHHDCDLATLDIRVITTEALRLDSEADQKRLEMTLILHRPILLLLDPLVRLHSIDENAAGEIAALLGYLRTLQRHANVAIALVHLSRVVRYAAVAHADRWAISRSGLHVMLGEADRRGIRANSSAYYPGYNDVRNSSSCGFGAQGAGWPSERSTVFQNASRACRFVFMFALVYRLVVRTLWCPNKSRTVTRSTPD